MIMYFTCNQKSCTLAEQCERFKQYNSLVHSSASMLLTDDPRKDNGFCHLFSKIEKE